MSKSFLEILAVELYDFPGYKPFCKRDLKITFGGVGRGVLVTPADILAEYDGDSDDVDSEFRAAIKAFDEECPEAYILM